MRNHHQAAETLSAKEALVLAALRATPRPCTAYQLINALRDEGIKAPPPVYRALNRLITLGHAHRLESLNAYVACRHGQCHAPTSAAFAICDDCGLGEEISASNLTDGITNWAHGSRFAVDSLTFELHGKCQRCRDGPPGDRHKL